MSYSSRIEKDFLKTINSFSEEEQNTIWQILLNDPKGSAATHWTIKKVHKDIWQLDLPKGYRLEYTVLGEQRFALVRFIGNHDDAADSCEQKSNYEAFRRSPSALFSSAPAF